MFCPKCRAQNQQGSQFCINCGSPLIVTPSQPQVAPAMMPQSQPPPPPEGVQSFVNQQYSQQPIAGVRYAGFWIRLVAFGIDLAVIMAIGLILGLILGMVGTVLGFKSVDISKGVNNLSNVIGLAYSIGYLGAKGATLGKMAVGIKVIRTDGRAISYGTAALREIIGKAVSFLSLLIGYFWIAWDAKKQGFHDKIADTIVIYSK